MSTDVPATGSDTIRDVLVALQALSQGLDHYRRATGARLHLGMPDIVTLAQLLYDEPMRAAEVGSRTGLSPGSVTALLDRLEVRGYITRVRPAENKRTVAIALTAEGRELVQGIFRPLEPLLLRATTEPGGLDPAGLARFLGRIAGALDRLGDAGPG